MPLHTAAALAAAAADLLLPLSRPTLPASIFMCASAKRLCRILCVHTICFLAGACALAELHRQLHRRLRCQLAVSPPAPLALPPALVAPWGPQFFAAAMAAALQCLLCATETAAAFAALAAATLSQLAVVMAGHHGCVKSMLLSRVAQLT